MYLRTGFGDAASAASSAALLGSGISAGVALAASGVQDWLASIQQSHIADTAATQDVNRLAPLLQANVDAFKAGPGTCADAAAAEAAYLSAYAWLISPAACGNGQLGSAGNRCISDRFGPGGPLDTSGTQWPWADYYYYPIANDPRVAGCAAQTASDNPLAGEQSAIANIGNLISGSNVQTTAGQFDTTTGTVGSTTGTTTTTAATALSTIPSWVWLAAAGLGLILILD